MIILSCNNLTKSFGVESILENISFTVNEGDKIYQNIIILGSLRR